jgi:hypothetical protein
MHSRIPRLLLATASAIFAFGGTMHAVAFIAKGLPSINGSNLPHFLRAEIKVLWLADSTTLTGMALVVGFIAAKPASASKAMIMLLAAIPASTTALLYAFLGPFYAGHMLLAASAMVFVAGLITPASNGANEFVRLAESATHGAAR